MIVRVSKIHQRKVYEHGVSSIFRREALSEGDTFKVFEYLEVDLDKVPKKLQRYYLRWNSESETLKKVSEKRGCSLRYAISMIREFKKLYGEEFTPMSSINGKVVGTSWNLQFFFREHFDEIELGETIPQDLSEYLKVTENDSDFIKEVKEVCANEIIVSDNLRYVWFFDKLISKVPEPKHKVGDKVHVVGRVVSVRDLNDVWGTFLFTIKSGSGEFFYKKGSKHCLDKAGYSVSNFKVEFESKVSFISNGGLVYLGRIKV